MQPAPCAQTPQPNRQLFCQHYKACLDVAVLQNWLNFSCLDCRDYKPLVRDPEEILAEGRACEALLIAALRPSRCKWRGGGRLVGAMEKNGRDRSI